MVDGVHACHTSSVTSVSLCRFRVPCSPRVGTVRREEGRGVLVPGVVEEVEGRVATVGL